ncbi:MAG: hypothetical protein U0U46_16090 [Saprospiraceae bacterium]
MKRLLLPLLLLGFNLHCAAQRAKILADPDVVWAAEIEILITPETPADWEDPDSLNRSVVLKTVHTGSPDSLLEDPPDLMAYLFKLAWEGRQPVFDANEPGKQLSAADLDRLLVRRDTGELAFDPEDPSLDVEPFVFVWTTGPDDCPLLRARQLLFYREKTADFGVLTLSLGPTLPNGRTLFWWNAQQEGYRRLPRLDQPVVTWARRITTRAASPEIKKVKALKQPETNFMSGFLHKVRNQASVEVLNLEWKPLSLDEREWVFNHVDTMVVFDVESYESIEKPVKFELNPDAIHQLRLVEDWYWDNSRQQLFTRLVAVAPLLDVFDSEGQFRYTRPLFYRKCR